MHSCQTIVTVHERLVFCGKWAATLQQIMPPTHPSDALSAFGTPGASTRDNSAPMLQRVPLVLIRPARHNPRTTLGDIDELSASMQEHGLLQPVVVRRRARGFELIAGHRRLEAARRLGWEAIPAVINEGKTDAYVLTLVENLQRADLTTAEEAAGLVELMRHHRWTTRQVAAAIKRSQRSEEHTSELQS